MNSGNYDLSYQGNNLTITKALLNVIVYGDADPSLTYQVSGLKNGDTAGAVLNGGSGITVLQAADLVGQARVSVAIDLGLGIGDQRMSACTASTRAAWH